MLDTSQIPMDRVIELPNTIEGINTSIDTTTTNLTEQLNTNVTDLQSQINNLQTQITNLLNELNAVKVKPRVIETYQSGTQWYRIYSDKWIEQGGFISASTNTSQINNFIKPFANTNYHINLTAQASNWTGGLNSVHARTTTGFKLWTSDDSSFNSCPIFWEAKGYMA